MKQLTSLIIAAFLGGLIALGGYHFLAKEETKVVMLSDSTVNAPIVRTNYTTSTPDFSVDFTKTAAIAMPAVVNVRASQDYARNGRRLLGEEYASGSGVIVSDDGYIVTNYHVIEGAASIDVVMTDNRTYNATLIGEDPQTDLALLKINEKGLDHLEYGDSDVLKIGEWVLAVGNPFDLASTVTAGIVSAKGRNINILDDQAAIESFIQTDAAVNKGNSGGALVDLRGQLIGINSAIATPTGTYTGYSFAIPSNIVMKVIEDLKDYGSVQRGYLGVMINNVNGDMAEELDLDITEGVYVSDLVSGGSAEKSGIVRGDVILEINRKLVKSSSELQEAIGRKRPGDKVKVTIYRNGKEKVLDVILRDENGKTRISSTKTDRPSANSSNKKIYSNIGIELKELSREEKQKFNIQSGVMITDILKGKVSDYTDAQEGFIITKINNQVITSLRDVERALSNSNGGVLLEGEYPGFSEKYYYGFGL